MITYLQFLVKRYFKPKAMVLMYHRIAEPESDVWNMAVSKANFEQQLQVLKSNWNVISLTELVQRMANNNVKKNSLALTFDDGYRDNFLFAKPLLEKHKVPATFFITSGNIGESREFWWDELEFILLLSKHLPPKLTLQFDEKIFTSDLSSEEYLTEALKEKHKFWRANLQPAPSKRCDLYLRLYEALQPLTNEEQLKHVRFLRKWSGIHHGPRPEYFSMKKEELIELRKSSYISIGSHTVSHPALALLSKNDQLNELIKNCEYLEEISGKKIEFLAYPYGSCNGDSFALAESLKFKAAFTTQEQLITADSNVFSLGRFGVPDIGGDSFMKFLSYAKQH